LYGWSLRVYVNVLPGAMFVDWVVTAVYCMSHNFWNLSVGSKVDLEK
jgi:hypothetical protein